MESHWVWIISLASIVLMLVRPFRLAEAIWVSGGALLLLLFQLVSWTGAEVAVLKGVNVYLFLIGMMILAELARVKGVFDWVAAVAEKYAGGSPTRLFLMIYMAGTGVTIFLSNDATAVVMTPAVLTLVQRLKIDARPYALACAFIANAASFGLPISNPANLVVYAQEMPPLLDWLALFTLPSVAAIVVTFIALRLILRKELRGRIEATSIATPLSFQGRLALAGLIVAALVLLTASALGWPLGLPTFVAGMAVLILISLWDHVLPVTIGKSLSWSVIPLVAGLFVIVEALQKSGLSEMAQMALAWINRLAPDFQNLAAAFGAAGISNVMNNLPVGLAAGNTLHSAPISHSMAGAVLIGVDLGPNLSVTGSLATILWLIALRREQVTITGWEFLKVGSIAMPLALIASVLVLR